MSNFTNLRRHSSYIEQKRINDLVTKQVLSEFEVKTIEEPEKQNLDSEHASGVQIKDDDVFFTKVKSITTPYKLPREPDPDILACHLKFENGGDSLKDYAFTGQQVVMHNAPLPTVIGNIDNGNEGGSIALMFNQGDAPIDVTSNAGLYAHLKQFVRVIDDGTNKAIRVSEMFATHTGVAFFYRMKQLTINQILGFNRKLFYKIDEDNVLNGFYAEMTPTKELRFYTLRNGTARACYAANAIDVIDEPDFNTENFAIENFSQELQEETLNETNDFWFHWNFVSNTMSIWKDDGVSLINITTGTMTATPNDFPVPISSCTLMPITVSASNQDAGYEATKAVDNNIATFFKTGVNGATFTIDTGVLKPICYLRIRFNYSNSRVYNFSLQYSRDGTTWTTQAEDVYSSGNVTGYETFDFPNIYARYVRLVLKGSNVNDETHINEIQVYGGDYVPPVEGVPVSPFVQEYNVTGNSTPQYQQLYANTGSTSSTIPASTIYNVTVGGSNPNLDNTFKRRGIYVTTGSPLIGKKINKITFKIKKEGSPSGTISCKIYDVSENSLRYTFPTTYTASQIGSSYSNWTFEDLTENAYNLTDDDAIVVEYLGGTSGDFIEVQRNETDQFDGTRTFEVNYNGTTWDLTKTTYDTVATIVTGGYTTTSTEPTQPRELRQIFKSGCPQIGDKLTKFEFYMFRSGGPKGVLQFALKDSAHNTVESLGEANVDNLSLSRNLITITNLDTSRLITANDYLSIKFIPDPNEPSHSSGNSIYIEINDSQIADTNIAVTDLAGTTTENTLKDIVGIFSSGGQEIEIIEQEPFIRFYDINSSDSANYEYIELTKGTTPTAVSPYNVTPDGSETFLSRLDHDREKVGIAANTSSSTIVGLKPTKAVFYVRKVGNPVGTIYCRIWNRQSATVWTTITTLGSKDVSTILTTETELAFENLDQTRTLQVNDIIGIEYTGGTVTDYIEVKRVNDIYNGTNTNGVNNDGVQWRSIPYDIVGQLWVGGGTATQTFQRVGEVAATQSSQLIDKVITQIIIYIHKVGNPTGTLNVRIRRGVDDTIAAVLGSMSATAIDTLSSAITFTEIENNYPMQFSDIITVEYDPPAGATSTDKILVKTIKGNTFDSTNSILAKKGDGPYVTSGLTTYDLAAVMWTGGKSNIVEQGDLQPTPLHYKDLFVNAAARGENLCNDTIGFNNSIGFEFRFYTIIPTQLEMDRLFTNKITIANIPYGEVAEVGFWDLLAGDVYTPPPEPDPPDEVEEEPPPDPEPVCPPGQSPHPVTGVCGNPPSCPSGFHLDPATWTCVADDVTPPPPTTSTSIPSYVFADQNLLQEIYDIRKPASQNAAKLYPNGARLTVEASGAVYVDNDTGVRMMLMYPGNFTDEDGPRDAWTQENCPGNFDLFRSRGYMLDPQEINAGIIYIEAEIHPTASGGDGGLTLEFFSGLTHESSVASGHAGSCYHAETNLNGERAVQKEQYHVNYTSQIVGGPTFNTAQRFGMIAVLKRINTGDRLAGCILELWGKLPNQTNWTLNTSRTDANDWGDAMDELDATFRPGEAITWGSDQACTIKGNDREYRIHEFKVYKINYAIP